LVINSGAGYAGAAALQLNLRQVVFMDTSGAKLINVWKTVLLNAPDNMTSARCFSTNGVHWATLDENISNPIW
jgi:hypothetical protein